MSKRKPKEHKAAPSLNGTMVCQKKHSWVVVDLNPERVNVLCPVCAVYTNIRQGLMK